MKTRLVFVIGLFCTAAVSARASAQQIPPVPALGTAMDIERVRTLYGAAAYEDALAALPVVNGEAVNRDVEQYRALCLLALGRTQEAVAAIERLVRDHPMYVPAAADTSPRMQAIFTSARSKLVPEAAKRAYAEAKAAYEAKNRDRAHTAFKQTLELIDSLSETEKPALSDLRLLAGEFLELSAPRLTAPEPASAPTKTTLKTEPDGEVVGPVAVREQLPSWIPPDSAARRSEYVGLIRVLISAEGRVTSVTVMKASHPAYDALAVTAAAKWLYKPATRDGQAVASSKEIQIRLVPQ